MCTVGSSLSEHGTKQVPPWSFTNDPVSRVALSNPVHASEIDHGDRQDG